MPSQTWDELGPVWESGCLVQVGSPGQPQGFIWAPASPFTLKRCPAGGQAPDLSQLRDSWGESLRALSCIMVFPLQPLTLLLVHPSNRSQREDRTLIPVLADAFFFPSAYVQARIPDQAAGLTSPLPAHSSTPSPCHLGWFPGFELHIMHHACVITGVWLLLFSVMSVSFVYLGAG